MEQGSDRRQRTVSEIFAGVLVPEAGHVDEHGPRAILSLRAQIARTIDRLVAGGPAR